MAYYFIGGEDFDFSPLGTPSVVTASTVFRAGYARCALFAGTTGGWRVPNSYALSVRGTSWLTAELVLEAGSPVPLVIFNGPGDVNALALYTDGSIWNIITDTSLATATSPIPLNVITKMDIEVVFSVTGSINVYFNGTLITTYSGDVTAGQASFNGFDLTGSGYWSEVIWGSADTRALSLVTLSPVANGLTDTWDVGEPYYVNQITINDAFSDQSGTPGQIELYTANYLPLGNFGIDAVSLTARGVTGSGAPQNLQLTVNVGGTNYNSSDFTQGPVWQRSANEWALNPNTSAAWTIADINSAGFNIGMTSVA